MRPSRVRAFAWRRGAFATSVLVCAIPVAHSQDWGRGVVTLQTPDSSLQSYRDSGFDSSTHESFVSHSSLQLLASETDTNVSVQFKLGIRHPSKGPAVVRLEIGCSARRDYPQLSGGLEAVLNGDTDHRLSLTGRVGDLRVIGPDDWIGERMFATLADSTLLQLAKASRIRMRIHRRHGVYEVTLPSACLSLLRYYACLRRV